MEEQKPKSVQTIGLIVAIFSGFIIFSNRMGALTFSLMGFGDNQGGSEPIIQPGRNILHFLFHYYIAMCLIMVTIGLLYLVGGLYVRKYKLWANKLVSYISVFLILVIWIVMIALSKMTAGHENMKIFRTIAILTAVFWSIPIGLLIWFLNKAKIKKHFA